MKNIVLIDYSLTGHHLSFLRSFSKILLEQGHRVICIAPEVSKVKDWMDLNCESVAHRFHAAEYRHEPRSFKRFGRFNHSASVLQKWKFDASIIQSVSSDLKLKVDLVFYAWIDNQLTNYLPSFILDRVFPFKWSGLYFHPYHLRLEQKPLQKKANWRDWDAIFLSNNCKAITIHDQGLVKPFNKRIGKPVIHFPETADDSKPDFNYSIYKKIKSRAKGRKVVGMIGCESHKGTLTLIDVVLKADSKRYFFAFIGMLPQNTYNNQEWKKVEKFIQEDRENCFFHFHPVPEGSAYNAVFCSFDIPFLVYDNFISSSNRLTKAAIFERLVLSSDNFCVGDDVKKYKLGEAIPPKNVEAAIEGLDKIAKRIDSNDLPYDQWKLYRELNSNEMLYERFAELTRLL
jgi:hypothetical protein